MITQSEAERLVFDAVTKKNRSNRIDIGISDGTIETKSGWVVFYNSKKFLETRIFKFRLAENGPVIVNKLDSSIEFYPSNKPVEQIIEEYESRHGQADE